MRHLKIYEDFMLDVAARWQVDPELNSYWYYSNYVDTCIVKVVKRESTVEGIVLHFDAVLLNDMSLKKIVKSIFGLNLDLMNKKIIFKEATKSQMEMFEEKYELITQTNKFNL